MKTSFTFRTVRYLALTIALAYLALDLNGQTSHLVTVTSFVFTPKDLTITAGDTVIWKNLDGSHNVDGQQTVFPLNAVSFGNSVGAGWTYKFVFNTPGTYNYHCDPHALMGMTGMITVNSSVTLAETPGGNPSKPLLFPNPANQYIELTIPRDYATIRQVNIYSITGALMQQSAFPGNQGNIRYDISGFRKGLYFMEITANGGKDVLKFIKQ